MYNYYHLGEKVFSTPCSLSLSLCFSLRVTNQVSCTHKTNGQHKVTYNLAFMFFEYHTEGKTILAWIVAGIQEGQSALRFLMNVILICNCYSFLNTATSSKDSLPIFILWFCRLFCSRDTCISFSHSAFNSRTISSTAVDKAYVFLFTENVLSLSELILST